MEFNTILMMSKKRLLSATDFALPKAKRQALRKALAEDATNFSPLTTTEPAHTCVELRYNTALCPNDFEFLAFTHPEITHLDLTGCFSLSHHAFPVITQLWGSSLLSLNLAWCHSLAENLHLTPSTSSHFSLRTLNLSNSNISDPGVRFFATRSPDLSTLNIQGCNITDLSLSLVAQFCKQVSVLNVSCCDKITNFGVQIIAQEMKSGLRELNLNDCRQLSGQILNYLGFYCPNITSLLLKDTNISGDEVVRICDVLQLSQLNVHGLSVNDHHLRAIAASQPSLEILDISFCRDVTLEGLMSLIKECPNLQELHMYGHLFAPDLESLCSSLKIYS